MDIQCVASLRLREHGGSPLTRGWELQLKYKTKLPSQRFYRRYTKSIATHFSINGNEKQEAFLELVEDCMDIDTIKYIIRSEMMKKLKLNKKEKKQEELMERLKDFQNLKFSIRL